jgi:hypothetical protein
MSNPAEELGYPAWVYPFTALVVLAAGLFVIYAAIAFINLDPNVADWSTFDRFAVVVLTFVWGRFVVKSYSELDADA